MARKPRIADDDALKRVPVYTRIKPSVMAVLKARGAISGATVAAQITVIVENAVAAEETVK